MATLAELEAELAAFDKNNTVESLEAELAAFDDAEVGQVEAAVRGLGQGATAGWGDEIMGRIAQGYIGLSGNNDLFEGNIYEQARDSIRTDTAAAQRDNPVTFGAGELAGAVLPISRMGGASSIPKAMGQGGLFGATYGAGEAASMADVPGAALEGAAYGAGGAGTMGLLGKAAGLGGKGLKAGGKAVASRVGKPAPPMSITSGDVATGMAAMATGGGPMAAAMAVGTKKLVGSGFSKLSATKQASVANKLTKFGSKFAKWAPQLQSAAAQGGEALVAMVNTFTAQDPEFARAWNEADNEHDSVKKLRNKMQSVSKKAAPAGLLGQQQNNGLL